MPAATGARIESTPSTIQETASARNRARCWPRSSIALAAVEGVCAPDVAMGSPARDARDRITRETPWDRHLARSHATPDARPDLPASRGLAGRLALRPRPPRQICAGG